MMLKSSILFSLLAAATTDSLPAPELSLPNAAAAPHPPEQGGADSEVTYITGCELGFAYSYGNRDCASVSAIQQMTRECTDSDGADATCIKVVTGKGESGWTRYYDKTVDKESSDKLTNKVIKAEGKGWGVSASAGVSYMSQNAMSSSSIGFWVGMSGDAYSKEFNNVQKLKLSKSAKQTLTSDWQMFLKLYGRFYVYKITHGSQFMGSAVIEDVSTSSASSLKAFSKISMSKFASGSTEFDDAEKEAGSSTRVSILSKQFGQPPKPYSDKSSNGVKQLMSDYNAYCAEVVKDPHANSAPTKMIFRSLLDVPDVLNILTTTWLNEPKALEAFQKGLPDSTTLDLLTQEYLDVETQRASLNLYLGSSCIKKITGALEEVRTAQAELYTQLAKLGRLDLDDIIAIQEQVLNGDYSWFIALTGSVIHPIDEMFATCDDVPAYSKQPLVSGIEFQHFVKAAQRGGDDWIHGYWYDNCCNSDNFDEHYSDFMHHYGREYVYAKLHTTHEPKDAMGGFTVDIEKKDKTDGEVPFNYDQGKNVPRRYLEPTPADKEGPWILADSVFLIRSGHKVAFGDLPAGKFSACTGDIYKGDGGQYVYICYKTVTKAELNEEVNATGVVDETLMAEDIIIEKL